MKRVHEAVARINNRIANKEFDEQFDALFRPKFSLRWYELFCRYRDTDNMNDEQFSARVASVLEWFSVFVPRTLREPIMARGLVWEGLDVELDQNTSSNAVKLAVDWQPDVASQENIRDSKPLQEWMHLCSRFYDSFSTRGTLYSFELVFGLLPCMEADAVRGPLGSQTMVES